MRRTLDVAVWGATGFTGQLIAKYISSHPAWRDVRWGIAGRDIAKLRLLPLNNPPTAVLTADISDPASLKELAASTKVLIAAAGPFSEVGTPVVEACVAARTHYVDITGETPWVYDIIRQFHTIAETSGVVVLPMCGFDSVPSDLAALTASRALAAAAPVSRNVSLVNYVEMEGRLSGGTVKSGLLMDENPAAAAAAASPTLLGSPRPATPADADVGAATFDAQAGVWRAPFMMAKLNTRVVRRSAMLAADAGAPLAACFTYTECAAVPDERRARAMVRASGTSAADRRRLVSDGALPQPGAGPSEAERRKGRFRMRCWARGEAGSGAAGEQGVVAVAEGGEAYEFTAACAAEAALLLTADPTPELPGVKGGVLTPATALGGRLRARLEERGLMKLAVVPPSQAFPPAPAPAKL